MKFATVTSVSCALVPDTRYRRLFVKTAKTSCALFVELSSHTRSRLAAHEATTTRKLRERQEAELASANLPTPEQQRHARYRIAQTQTGVRRAQNQESSNLEVYLNRGHLDDHTHTGRAARDCGLMRYSAGMKFFQDFRRTGFLHGFKSCLNVSLVRVAQISPGMNINFHAYHEWQQAAEAIHPRYRKITIEVCCRGEWLADVRTSIPAYRRMDALQRGLDMLIDFYETRINPRKIKQSFSVSLATTQGEVPTK